MDAKFQDKLYAGHEGDCPTCGRYAKVYKRRVYATIVRQMRKLFMMGGDRDYIHVSLLTLKGIQSGDIAKAQYFGLVKEKENEDTNKKCSGYWMLTPEGIEFLYGRHTIPEYALIYDGRVLGFDGAQVNVKQCLGKNFNYETLMGAG